MGDTGWLGCKLQLGPRMASNLTLKSCSKSVSVIPYGSLFQSLISNRSGKGVKVSLLLGPGLAQFATTARPLVSYCKVVCVYIYTLMADLVANHE